MIYLLSLFFCISRVNCRTHSDSTHKPRMIFKANETINRRFLSTISQSSVETLLSKEMVVSGSGTHLYFYNFSDPNQTPNDKRVSWNKCQTDECSYNITLVHTMKEGNSLFLCGTNPEDMACCVLDLKSFSKCHSTNKVEAILKRVETHFNIKEGEHFVFSEFENNADLFVTSSGKEEIGGILKFGSKLVRPYKNSRETYHVGLLTNRGANVTIEDKIYAFYRQMNKDGDKFSEKWFAFVSRYCMNDAGGPKMFMQFSWTSKLSARLYCGDQSRKIHLTEIIDVVSVRADKWEDTKVYALFRNDWGVSAVCVYLMKNIDDVFLDSPFKGHPEINRHRNCVPDSTKISNDGLKQIRDVTEMENAVEPESFFYLYHDYTHIQVDNSYHHAILYLALSNGRIHKVAHDKNKYFVVAEYQPFIETTHIFSILFDPQAKWLYVRTQKEMVRLNVNNCAKYGNNCVDCNLSRDPGCSWNGSACISESREPFVTIFEEKDFICPTKEHIQAPLKKLVSPQGMFFMQCPVSSSHARYSWNGPQSCKPCHSGLEPCHLLLNNITSELEGVYTCEREERGHKAVVMQYKLELSVAPRRHVNSLVWLSFIAALIHSLCLAPC